MWEYVKTVADGEGQCIKQHPAKSTWLYSASQYTKSILSISACPSEGES